MPAAKPKVLVAMSGGVDSSVAAALLIERGYDAVGCFMRLGSPGETLDELIPGDQACNPKVKIGHQGCCSINDAADARLVAAHLGIPFYVCNFKKDFGRIIDYFADEYAAGRTPNPCVRCNDWLKFGKLHDYATQIGADFVASGHYARIRGTGSGGTGFQPVSSPPTSPSSPPPIPSPTPSLRHSVTSSLPHSVTPSLLRAIDHTKDQSYVLFGAPRERLARMLLPIGDYPKSEVRELARARALPVYDKPDSQEICFVPDNNYAGLVERRRPHVQRPGRIVDQSGNDLGEHAGQHRFTIGQRRGLSLSLGHPVYVVAKDAASNTVTVGPQEALAVTECLAGEANWLVDPPDSAEWTPTLAKFRYNSRAVPAAVRCREDLPGDTPSGRHGAFEVRFDRPQHAVAAGQAIVLYAADDPDMVLGGGWIQHTA